MDYRTRSANIVMPIRGPDLMQQLGKLLEAFSGPDATRIVGDAAPSGLEYDTGIHKDATNKSKIIAVALKMNK